jgi:hypothetical protein
VQGERAGSPRAFFEQLQEPQPSGRVRAAPPRFRDGDAPVGRAHPGLANPLNAFSVRPRPQRERCHSERCGVLCTPPSCFREGLALAGTEPETGWGPGPPSWTRPPALHAASGVPIGTTSPVGTRSHACLTGSHGQTPRPRAPEGVYAEAGEKKAPVPASTGVKQGRPWAQHRTRRRAGGNGPDGPHARATCQPTNRAPPGTREALVGRRGSPVASLALGRVIGQWGHRARHRGGARPGRLATRPRHVRAARIVLGIGS